MLSLFPNTDQVAVKLPPQALWNRFMKLNNQEQQVKFVLQHLHDCSEIPNVESKKKSQESSEEYYKIARKIMDKRDPLDSAIENFTKAIAFAPPLSRQLSLCYVARAEALISGRLYEDGLLDISRALKQGYPKKLRAKLYAYQAKCLTALRQPRPVIRDAIANAKKNVEKLNDNDKKIVDEIFKEVKKRASIPEPFKKWDDKKYLPEAPNNNPVIPGASDAVEIAYDADNGRHVVATREIKCGEVLMVHKDYMSVLTSENSYTHCSNCLKQIWSGLPCNGCASAGYCSENCRDEALADYHDLECPILDYLLAAGLTKVILMGVRVTFKALKEFGSLEALKEEVERIDSLPDSKTKGFTGEVFDSNKYASFYTLKTSSIERPPLIYKMAVDASQTLYLIATKTKLFGQTYEDIPAILNNKFATFLGGLLMKNMEICKMNGNSMQDECLESSDIGVRGGAIWNFLSLWDHSCEYMTFQLACADHTAMIAFRKIKKGEKIRTNYGPCYQAMSLNERQIAMMQQFGRPCDCLACQRNWGPLTIFPSIQELKRVKYIDTVGLYECLHKFRTVCLSPSRRADNLEPDIKIAMKTLDFIWCKVNGFCREMQEIQKYLMSLYTRIGNRHQVIEPRKIYRENRGSNQFMQMLFMQWMLRRLVL